MRRFSDSCDFFRARWSLSYSTRKRSKLLSPTSSCSTYLRTHSQHHSPLSMSWHMVVVLPLGNRSRATRTRQLQSPGFPSSHQPARRGRCGSEGGAGNDLEAAKMDHLLHRQLIRSCDQFGLAGLRADPRLAKSWISGVLNNFYRFWGMVFR